MNDKREHLWITDGEVKLIENKPTGRSKPIVRDFKSHGTKLSEGLSRVLDAKRKNDSLTNEDIVVFEIELGGDEKISNNTRLQELRTEGISINYVKSKKRAIVSTNKKHFNRLEKHIELYRSTGRMKKFQYVESFDAIKSSERMTKVLSDKITQDKESLTDIQIVIIPNIDEYTRERIASSIKNRIPPDSFIKSYYLSDGTGVIRAKLNSEKIEELSNDSAICSLDLTRVFGIERMFSPIDDKVLTLDKTQDYSELPIVTVLDDGIAFPNEFENLIIEHWTEGVIAPKCSHGTEVASKVIFGNIDFESDKPLNPRARVIDCPVYQNGATEDELIERIGKAVAKYSSISKIFNLSINETRPITGDDISLIGYELDALSLKYNVVFVISAGNHELYLNSHFNIDEIIDDDDSRIAAPADSMLNVAVGAVCGENHPESITKKDMVTTYTTIGPGPLGYIKPDLAAYGATRCPFGIALDKYAVVMKNDGKKYLDCGTSFTAPQVAGDLAQIMNSLSEKNVLLAQLLLYHGCSKIESQNTYSKRNQDLFGRGLPNIEESINSSDYKVTFVRTGTINRVTKHRVKFFIPSLLSDDAFKGKIKIKMSCLVSSPVDRTKGPDYLGAYVRCSIHKINKAGNNVNAGNSEMFETTGNDCCVQLEREFTSFSSGDWEIWLELFSRWGVEKEEEVNYAVAITLEDESKTVNVYENVLNEAQQRFVPLSQVRERTIVGIYERE